MPGLGSRTFRVLRAWASGRGVWCVGFRLQAWGVVGVLGFFQHGFRGGGGGVVVGESTAPPSPPKKTKSTKLPNDIHNPNPPQTRKP